MEEQEEKQYNQNIQDNEEGTQMREELQESTSAQQTLQEQEIDYQAKYLELKDQYVRAFADFENTKKRLERDKNQSLEYAYERIMNDLLPVLDTLEKALESAQSNPEAGAIAQGLHQRVVLIPYLISAV